MVSDGLPWLFAVQCAHRFFKFARHNYRHALQRFADSLVDLLALLCTGFVEHIAHHQIFIARVVDA